MAWKGWQFMIYCWVALGVTFSLVLARLYVNIKGLRGDKDNRLLRDTFVVTSLILLIIATSIFQYLNGYHFYEEDFSVYLAQPVEVLTRTQMFNAIHAFLYQPGIYLCKFDLLLMYHVLAPKRHNPKIYIAILVAWFFCISGFLVQIFYLAFRCVPFSDNWSIDSPPCSNSLAYPVTVWTFFIFSDVLVYAIPCVIISKMKMLTLTRKLSAAAMFVLGFFNVLCAAEIVTGLTPYPFTDTYWFYGATMFLYQAQQFTALWIVCLPHAKTALSLAVKRGPSTPEKKALGGSVIDMVMRSLPGRRRAPRDPNTLSTDSTIASTVRPESDDIAASTGTLRPANGEQVQVSSGDLKGNAYEEAGRMEGGGQW